MKHIDRMAQNPLLRDANKILYFFLAAERRSIRKAAVELKISQPSFSRSLRDFEARLGVKLMVRSGTGIELTPAGKALHEYSKNFVKNSVELHEFLAPSTAVKIRFGTHEILFSSLVEALFSDLQDLDIVENSPSVLTLGKKVETGALDVALVVESDRLKGSALMVDEVFEDHYSLFYNPKILKIRAAKDMEKVPIAYMPQSIATSGQTLQEVLMTGALPNGGLLKLSSLESVKSLVTTGRAIGILPCFSMYHELRKGSAREVRLPELGWLRSRTKHRLSMITRSIESNLRRYEVLREKFKGIRFA